MSKWILIFEKSYLPCNWYWWVNVVKKIKVVIFGMFNILVSKVKWGYTFVSSHFHYGCESPGLSFVICFVWVTRADWTIVLRSSGSQGVRINIMSGQDTASQKMSWNCIVGVQFLSDKINRLCSIKSDW